MRGAVNGREGVVKERRENRLTGGIRLDSSIECSELYRKAC